MSEEKPNGDFFERISQLKIKRKALIAAIVVAVAAAFFLFSPYGIIKSFKLAGQRTESFNELLEIKRTNDSLRDKIHEIRTDSSEIERIAREKYGMVKKGERVFIRKKFDNQKK